MSKQCEEKEVFCHEDHNEPQKAVSYCPQCPGGTEDLLEHGIPEEQICLKKSVVQRIAAITASPFLASGPLCSIHFDSSAINTSLGKELSQVDDLMGRASPQNCTMVNLPALVDDGLLRVQNMPFSSEVITRDEDSSWAASGVTASLDPLHFLPLNRVLAIYGGLVMR